MHNVFLERLGLSQNEAILYECLLTKGRTPARDLVTATGLGRGNVYNILGSLVAKGIVVMTEGTKQEYQAAEPNALRALVDAKISEAERVREELAIELPRIISTFNITTGKPTVQVFEGVEGLKAALNDTLDAKNGILTYVDMAAIAGPLEEVDQLYVKQRIRKGILKQIIVCDTKESREYIRAVDPRFTDVAFIPEFSIGSKTAVQIYNDSVLFITLEATRIISVLISDRAIAQMHREHFQFLWKHFATQPSEVKKL